LFAIRNHSGLLNVFCRNMENVPNPLLLSLLLLTYFTIPLSHLNAQRSNQGMGPLLDQATVKPGDTIPSDLVIYTAEGTKTTLAQVATDKHTVLVSGCLTCPIFHRSYPSVEAVYADYKDNDKVQFFFMYKSLAHPELNGYVQAATLEERLTHIVEAKRVLGTTIPWLCDDIDNAVRHALGMGPNTQIVIDPSGKIVHALGWSDGDVLRNELIAKVGPSETTTRVADLNFNRGKPYKEQRSYGRGILEKPTFSSELIPVKITPIDSADSPLYVKPRLEVDQNVLNKGEGELYLGFFLDPIHHVHWNNLAAPLKYELILPDGTKISPANASAPAIEQETDSDPREFGLSVSSLGDNKTAELAIHYYACSDEEGWCRAVTQKYAISFERDIDGGGTNGRSFRVANAGGRQQGRGGRQPRGGPQQGGAEDMKRRILEMDSNSDGLITLEEAPEQMRARFADMDENGDGKLDAEEIDLMAQRRGPQGGGRGAGGRPGGQQPGQGNPGSIKKRILESDANGDGKVTLEEIPEQMKRRFEQMDANSDGFVDEAEIDAMLQNRPTQPGGRRPGQGPGRGQGRPGGPNA
jgi:Ca2+-binding EF-hand superfamily protein